MMNRLFFLLLFLLPLPLSAQITREQYEAFRDYYTSIVGVDTAAASERLEHTIAAAPTKALRTAQRAMQQGWAGDIDAAIASLATVLQGADMRERDDSLFQALMLDAMASAYVVKNDPREFEGYQLRAMRLYEAISARDSEPAYMRCLQMTGAYYKGAGLINQAADYYSRLKNLMERRLLGGVPYVETLCELSGCLLNTDPLMAKMLADEGARQLPLLADYPPDLALLRLASLSNVYASLRLFGDNRRLLVACRQVIDRGDVSDGPIAQCYMQMAYAQFIGMNFDGLKRYAREALQYVPDHMSLLAMQSLGEQMTGDTAAATTAARVAELYMQETATRFAFFSTDERSAYWTQTSGLLECINYIIGHEREPRSDLLYSLALWSKGLLLRAATHVMEQAKAQGGQTARVAERIAATRERLQQHAVPADSVALLRDSLTLWDKYLTRAVSSYATPEQIRAEYAWENIERSLTADAAAVEFIALPDTLTATDEPTEQRYYALVLRHGDAAPRLVRLCLERELADLMAKNADWKTNDQKLPRYVRQLYTCGSPRLYHGEQMYSLVWEPLEAALRGVHTVYFSPIGQLNQVAFNALSHDSTYVSDRYTLRQVTSTREVSRPAPAQRIRTAHLYGGVDYLGTDSTLKKAAREATRGLAAPATPSALPTTRGSEWHFLYGTLEEQVYLDSLLRARKVRVVALDSLKANEESLKHIEAGTHDLLHIGTHGYYLPADEAARTATFFERLQDAGRTDDAMLRSGLILAGGNRAWTGRDVVPGIEDGIVTAREIANIDLRGTQLCVLSACETALGDISGAEGVMGLQRGLKQAGVEGIIVTLWRVNDEATSLFMRTFYTSLLQTADRHKAFRQAVETVRAHEAFASPYFWAPFVMLD